MSADWPDLIQDERQLDDWLTRPPAALVDCLRTLASPLVILGAGGKMGPTLAVLAKRAADLAGAKLEVIAVSRFGAGALRDWLEAQGVRTLAADLLDRQAVRTLPDAPNVVYLVGLKFGTKENPALTWAVNTQAPALVAERYADARIVALSTGNVYPLVPACEGAGGAAEDCPLTPVGEYARAVVARERVFDECSRRNGTRIALIRLNYALELRYGVLSDIARMVWNNEPVPVANGFFNCIWQGDANDMILRALPLAAVPAAPWNLTCPGALRVRTVAETFGAWWNCKPSFSGVEADTALLSNPAKLCAALGFPPTPLDVVMRWTAHWVKHGGRSLHKPTHFAERDGQY